LRRERYVASVETLEHARSGYETLREVEARLEVSDIHFIYAFCLLWSGRLDEAESHLREILTDAERVGYATVQARCVAYLALIGRKRGDISMARCWADRTLEIAATSGMAEYVAAAEAHLAWAALREGDREAAADRARRAYEEGEKMGGAYHVLKWIVAWPLLAVRLHDGDLDGALTLVRQLLAPEVQPPPAPIADALAAAIGASDVGHTDLARERLLEAADLAREPGYL
jgi:ATP/maltotriose-dependent transcriptional regulator MalT